jgi:hypothetical protein
MEACQGKTAEGKQCKKASTNGRFCHIHGSKVAKSKTPAKAKARRVRSPEVSVVEKPVSKGSAASPRGAGKKKAKVSLSPPSPESAKPMSFDESIRSLEAEWRSDRMSPGMGSLGWSPTKAKMYIKGPELERLKKHYPEELKDRIPFPVAFTLVADKLESICKTIPFGSCQLHPTMPGIQWDNNNNDDYKAIREEIKKEMHKKGNHYFHAVDKSENSHYPAFDQSYCMCHEWGTDNNAFATLNLPLVGEDAEWSKIHGSTADDERGNDALRVISPALRKKIMADTIDYLGQEYKIHLQPKPEYQLPVVRALAKLIASDPVFTANIEAWKTIIPYNRVTKDLNLPVVVIYPARSRKSATLILKRIIEVFGKFNCAKIGLNHTPRFNHKVNELIYYANGSGDHKKNLPEKFFTGPGKEFYIGHELHL